MLGIKMKYKCTKCVNGRCVKEPCYLEFKDDTPPFHPSKCPFAREEDDSKDAEWKLQEETEE